MKYLHIHPPRFLYQSFPFEGDSSFENNNTPISQAEWDAARMRANDTSASELMRCTQSTPKGCIQPPAPTFRKVERPSIQRVWSFGASPDEAPKVQKSDELPKTTQIPLPITWSEQWSTQQYAPTNDDRYYTRDKDWLEYFNTNKLSEDNRVALGLPPRWAKLPENESEEKKSIPGPSVFPPSTVSTLLETPSTQQSPSRTKKSIPSDEKDSLAPRATKIERWNQPIRRINISAPSQIDKTSAHENWLRWVRRIPQWEPSEKEWIPRFKIDTPKPGEDDFNSGDNGPSVRVIQSTRSGTNVWWGRFAWRIIIPGFSPAVESEKTTKEKTEWAAKIPEEKKPATDSPDLVRPENRDQFNLLKEKANKTQEEINEMTSYIQPRWNAESQKQIPWIWGKGNIEEVVKNEPAGDQWNTTLSENTQNSHSTPEGRTWEDGAYLTDEWRFQEGLQDGTMMQKNAQGEPIFTETGRAAFRRLTLTEHGYIPGALFSSATFGADSMPLDPQDQEEALLAQEKQFIKNYSTHAELSQTPSEKTLAHAERIGSQAKKHLVNGGEDTVSFDTSKWIVSWDDPDLSIEHWRNYDYTQRKHGYPKLTVFSDEKDTGGRPRISGTVIHPDDPRTKEIQDELARGVQYPNLYTTQMDVNGNGKLQQVFILPPSIRADGYAVNQSLWDVPMWPSKIAVLKEKKLEKESLN